MAVKPMRARGSKNARRTKPSMPSYMHERSATTRRSNYAPPIHY
ncbi:MAG: hypothetical protein ACHP7H_01475 [Hyphomicrobiales bacterium]